VFDRTSRSATGDPSFNATPYLWRPRQQQHPERRKGVPILRTPTPSADSNRAMKALPAQIFLAPLAKVATTGNYDGGHKVGGFTYQGADLATLKDFAPNSARI
jgi:hypothetical protein